MYVHHFFKNNVFHCLLKMNFVQTRTPSSNRNCRLDVVADNFVDKDVQSMLLPLNLMQQLYFCPKYRIRGNFILPNNLFSRIISLCGTVIFLSFLFYRFFSRIFIKSRSEFYKIDFDGITCFDFIFSSTGFLINFFAVIFQTDKNVVFVSKFLYIHKFLNNKTAFKHFIIGNWLSVILTLAFGIIFVVIVNLGLKLPSHNLICGLILINADTNTVYAIRIIMLLKNKVHLWNIQGLSFQSFENRDKVDYCTKLYQVYIYILDCYDIYKVVFQKMVSKK